MAAPSVKDEELTDQVRALEKEVPDDADASRKAVRELIERKYTLPAENVRPSDRGVASDPLSFLHGPVASHPQRESAHARVA